MDDKTAQLIERLSTKLGTTVEHLWGILIKQAPISAATMLIFNGAMIVFLWLMWRKLKTIEFEKWDSDFGKGALWGGFIIAVIITLCFFASDFSIIFAGFFNPEFWALKQLMP
jgi:hypothetical protein